MARTPILPLPEIVARGTRPWIIKRLQRGGHTLPAERIFAAPLDATAFARAVRAHELGHVRFSPAKPNADRHGVGRDTLLAVEDGRVHELLWRTGLGGVIEVLDDPTIPPPDPPTHLRGAVLLLVAVHRTAAAARLRSAYKEAGDAGEMACHLADRALAAFIDAPVRPGFRLAIAVARILDRLLGTGDAEATGHCAIDVLLGGEAAGKPRGLFRRRPTGVASPAWGTLRRVDEPPRPIPAARGLLARMPRARAEGVLPRWLHRLPIDGHIWADSARRHAGSVLIDASGSMHLKKEDLLGIIDVAPGALVACYEGDASGFGEIRVLARAGRRVTDDLITGPTGKGGNVIDGPALQWLARQPSPRVWLSDGVVTGVGDAGSPALTEEAERICRTAEIVRVNDAAAVGRVLRGPAGVVAPTPE